MGREGRGEERRLEKRRGEERRGEERIGEERRGEERRGEERREREDIVEKNTSRGMDRLTNEKTRERRENKVLRKIFGAKRDEVTGEWRKLHNAELHALYSSPDIIRNIKSKSLRWTGHVARMGESRNAYRVLVGRPEGKRPLGRPRRRWENNIKMDLREEGYDDRDWINLAEDRDRWRAYVRAAMNLRVPYKPFDLIHFDFIPEVRTVSKEAYVAILRGFRDAVRRRRPNLWQGQNWVLHHNNAPAHRSLLVSEFLAQHKIPVLPQPPYSPDLAPADFY
ncbi:hypothetical protein ANN_06367 [Periplaneta americana]|uniref:Uncharacterized protein n=1 Tax=Periplaneta americana TaxID=6978 RepID=A0ABQ8TFP1_PERAM|nr:hypothetical protein ANN_06367 [Periplaneta americana]